MRKYIISFGLAAVFMTAGCNKMLELDPKDSLTTERSLSTIEGIKAATAGMYASLRSANYYGRSMFLYGDLSGDDVYISSNNSNRYLSTYQRNYAAVDADILGMWTAMYNTIARANNIINNADKVNASQADKDLQKGQALFVRALAYFDLVCVFAKPYNQGNGAQAGVPIVLESNVNHYPARNTVEEVYQRIITDLNDAVNLLAVTTSSTKVTASKYAAKALLSRVYLYKGDLTASINAATDVINAGYQITSAADLEDFYATPGAGADIFTVKFLITDNLSSNNLGNFYLKPGYGDARISPELVNVFDQDKDARFIHFLSPFNGSPAEWQNNKYFGQDGVFGMTSPKVLRIEEVYLNRAEAYAKDEQYALALADLNAIRVQRGLDPVNVDDDQVLDEILEERRRELMFEGHRFFDLMRNEKNVVRNYCNQPTQVNSPNCTITVTADYAIAPIPQTEIDANSQLRGQQNPGY